MKITAAMIRAARKQLASSGGKARAAKYSKKQLREWAKKGGRPRKETPKQATKSSQKGSGK